MGTERLNLGPERRAQLMTENMYLGDYYGIGPTDGDDVEGNDRLAMNESEQKRNFSVSIYAIGSDITH